MQNSPMTVKHVRPDGGVTIYPAGVVASMPDGNTGSRGIPSPAKKIEFDCGDGTGVRTRIDSGVAYVMNQNGKTVDTFHFPIEDVTQ